MKLLFDARYIRTDFHDGISRFSTELASALASQTKVTFLICDPAQRQFLPKDADYLQIHRPTSMKEPFTPQVLNSFKPDVVFSPMQTMGAIGRKYKLILTSHDMIYYRHRTPPQSLPALIRLGWRLYHLTYAPQRLTLNAADMVATVSHTVKREFEQARLTKRPIIVIPNAPGRIKQTPAFAATGPRNILYMGSFMAYKNVETLIRGMADLPDHRLHLLSKINPQRRRELSALIPRGSTVIFHNGVSDESYQTLLADNAVLATASLDEGYGLPVAEALAMGVPVVVSNIPIFHEVAAGGALYFDPHTPQAFARQVKHLDDQQERDTLMSAGTAHISTFSWETSARSLLNAIKSLV